MAEQHDGEHRADPEFEREQQHLSDTYAILERLRDELSHELDTREVDARKDLKDLSDEVRPDFGGADETIETLAAIETLNSVIDTYNQHHDIVVDKLRRALVLLMQPYFAMVRIQMRPGRPPRDIYIGTVGITDERSNPIVIDWRAPVASTYYSQQTGRVSYSVDGRERTVDLKLRRQYDIVRDHLNAYFDTTVAIQDSLLLSALKQHHSEKLGAITATIQREQNEVVRHADVPALLVRGIAGSGKTSVMLQRIAYLFYEQRDRLRPEDVWLFTPNDVFARYIDTVLPSLGESNPHTLTWRSFLAELGLSERGDGRDVGLDTLDRIGRGVRTLSLEEDDLRGISVDGTTILSQHAVASIVAKKADVPLGRRWWAQVRDSLHDRVRRRIATLARSEELQEEMLGLDLERQLDIFGTTIAPEDDKETFELARRYADHLWGDAAHAQVEDGSWLRVDRIGMRVLGTGDLSAAEWLSVRLALTGAGSEAARYVMVDEAQDYTATQLAVLLRYFPNAHFMLLGDPNQAIREGTATLEETRRLLREAKGGFDECELLTSYRSSPEITRLFMGLVPANERARSSSVREAGTAPEVVEVASGDADEYLGKLLRLVRTARDEEGLTAVICAEDARAAWLARRLGDEAPRVRRGERLPKDGVVLMDLALAKGLEFDHVIVADAQEAAYPDTPLARRRLYTCVSRAMHRVTLVSQGPLSPLLRGVAEEAHTTEDGETDGALPASRWGRA